MKTLFVADGHNYVPDWIVAHIGVIGYNIVVGITFLFLIYVVVIRPIIPFFKKKENGQPGNPDGFFLHGNFKTSLPGAKVTIVLLKPKKSTCSRE